MEILHFLLPPLLIPPQTGRMCVEYVGKDTLDHQLLKHICELTAEKGHTGSEKKIN